MDPNSHRPRRRLLRRRNPRVHSGFSTTRGPRRGDRESGALDEVGGSDRGGGGGGCLEVSVCCSLLRITLYTLCLGIYEGE